MQPAPGPKAAPVSLSVANVLSRQVLTQDGRLVSSRSKTPLAVAVLSVRRLPVEPSPARIPTVPLPFATLSAIRLAEVPRRSAIPCALLPFVRLFATLQLVHPTRKMPVLKPVRRPPVILTPV